MWVCVYCQSNSHFPFFLHFFNVCVCLINTNELWHQDMRHVLWHQTNVFSIVKPKGLNFKRPLIKHTAKFYEWRAQTICHNINTETHFNRVVLSQTHNTARECEWAIETTANGKITYHRLFGFTEMYGNDCVQCAFMCINVTRLLYEIFFRHLNIKFYFADKFA